MSDRTDKSVAVTYIKGIKLVARWRKWLMPSMVLSELFKNLSPYITIYMSAEIVNELAGGRSLERLISLVLFTVIADFAVVIIGALFNRLRNYEQQAFNFQEKRMFMEYGFSLDYEHLENPEIQRRRRKIDESKNINMYGIMSMLYSVELFTSSVIKIVLSLCFMSSMFTTIIMNAGRMNGAALYPAAIVLLVALSVFLSIKNSKKISILGNDVSNSMLNINLISRGFSTYQTEKDIRVYNMGGLFQKQGESAISTHKGAFRKFYFGMRNTQIPDEIISQGLNFTIYAFVCLNAVRGLFEIGSVIKYVGFISKLVEAVKLLSTWAGVVRMNDPFLRHYLEFFEIENKMYRGTLPVEKRNDNEYEIEFKNVSFKYPGSDTFALKNLSMKFIVGQRMAVVGMNGSGKTTMIKLLCRMYDPTEGAITLNGVDIKKYDYKEYMDIFSVVFQDFKLFSFTLGQNVAASVNFKAEDTKKRLVMAGFSERLNGMQQGLETPLYKDFDSDGVELSGGEAQKIALARALYKNAPFIVLDEPTAALDPIAEYEIYSKFNEIIGDKTAIYISHRLSSCRFCDDIAVFHEGEMIQRGNHDSLIADADGKYFELWTAQAQYYTENQA